MRTRALLFSIAAILIAALVIAGFTDGLLVDLLWFTELGYRGVFTTTLSAEVVIFVVIWVVTFLAISLSGILALGFSRERQPLRTLHRDGEPAEVNLPEMLRGLGDRVHWKSLVFCAARAGRTVRGGGRVIQLASLLEGHLRSVICLQGPGVRPQCRLLRFSASVTGRVARSVSSDSGADSAGDDSGILGARCIQLPRIAAADPFPLCGPPLRAAWYLLYSAGVQLLSGALRAYVTWQWRGLRPALC